MENDTITGNVQRIADISFNAYKSIIEGMLNNYTPLLKIPGIKFRDCDNCPPEPKCPPHCIASITRHAMQGERIVVPVMVKNTCSTQKTYRVGVRELKNMDGQLAPSQPHLNKETITLQPNEKGRVMMVIDLANFTTGATYNTEIVLREREINQNICFALVVSDHQPATVAEPEEEKAYKLRWQSWKSHFYCEPPASTK